ncbi:STAS domain-containing protein [Vreelandella sp. EE22]
MLIEEGRIKAAFDSGVFILKLCGDVRLTLCATLDVQAQRLADTPGLHTVMIDLREASNVDSSALGFLAKVAMAVKGRLAHPPTIIANNPDIQKMLDVMGFDRFFTLIEAPLQGAAALNETLTELPEVPSDEEGLRDRILEAHRILMHMNEHNREQFQPLVDMLEAQDTPVH